MKIGILTDTHLGIRRFYEESFKQAESALNTLKDVDIIIHSGDIFDVSTPSVDTLYRAYNIFSKAPKEVLAITGNHETTAREKADPVRFLDSVGVVKHIGGKAHWVGKNLFIGMDYVNEALAEEQIEALAEKYEKERKEAEETYLIIHQTVKDYFPGEGVRKKFLERYGFNLIICGHIHKRVMDKDVLLAGSTIATKIDAIEAEPRGVVVYDSKTEELEFREIEQRPFVYREMDVDGKMPNEIKELVVSTYKDIRSEKPDAIIRIKLKGKMPEGVKSTIISIPRLADLSVDTNSLVAEGLEKQVEEWKTEMSNSKHLLSNVDETLIKVLRDKVPDADKLFRLLSEGDVEGSRLLLLSDEHSKKGKDYKGKGHISLEEELKQSKQKITEYLGR